MGRELMQKKGELMNRVLIIVYRAITFNVSYTLVSNTLHLTI